MAVRMGIAPLLALCALALAAAPATAAPDTVPSGNSGADQYTESLPGAEGNQTSKNLREKQGKTGQKGALSKKDIERLKALGKEGADAAELAAAGAAANGGAAGGGEGGASADEDGGSGAVQALRAAAGVSDGGVNPLLASLIALAALAALALVLVRRRNRLS